MPKTTEPPKVKKTALEQAYEMVMRLASQATPQPARLDEPKRIEEPRPVRTMTTYGAIVGNAHLTDA